MHLTPVSFQQDRRTKLPFIGGKLQVLPLQRPWQPELFFDGRQYYAWWFIAGATLTTEITSFSTFLAPSPTPGWIFFCGGASGG